MTASGRRRVTRHCKQNSTTAARKHAYASSDGSAIRKFSVAGTGQDCCWFLVRSRVRGAEFAGPENDGPRARCMPRIHQEISRSLRAHTEAFQVTSEDDSDRDADANSHESVNSTPPAIATSTVTAVAASDDMCEVCLIEPRDRLALVPCGQSRFCSSCTDAVAFIPNGCPICRTPIASVLHVFM